MTAEPPLFAGAVNVIVAWPLPAVAAETVCGAPGTPLPGVTLGDGTEAGPAPIKLLAVTVKVYAVPLVSPVTTSGLPGPDVVMPPGLDVTV